MRAHAAALCALVLLAAHERQTVHRTSKNGLHFTDEGRGPAVVLIHAFHMDLREWDDVAQRIEGKRRVLRYDVRGHGRSPALEPLPPSVDDLLSLLDELGIARGTLVGSSMGSTIALDFALTHPARVDRLILLSPGIPGIKTTASFDWMRPIIAAVKEKNANRAAALWWESPMVAGLRRLRDAARYRAIVLDNAGIWTIARPPPSLAPPAGGRLQEVGIPVTVAAGELDPSGSIDNARAVAAGIEPGTLVVFPSAGHMLSIERAEDVSRWILNSRAKNEGRRTKN